MKTTLVNEEWYYEFSPLPTFSENGHFTVKAGKIGRPICIIPMPIAGINTKQKQEEIARIISAIPPLIKACAKITSNDYGTAPSVGYMDEMKLRCELALKSALEGDEMIEIPSMLTKEEHIAVEFCKWYQLNGYKFASYESNFEDFIRIQLSKKEKSKE